MRADEPFVEPVFVNSGRYTYALKYAKYFDDRGTLVFPATESKEYHTVFGPVFMHKGVLPANTNLGLSSALTRLTGKRKPLVIGLHEELTANQFRNMTLEYMDPWIKHVQAGLTCTEPPDVLRKEWTHRPHNKRRLRVRTEEEENNGPSVHPTYVRKARYKMKAFEMLAPDKRCRAVADLGAPAASVLGYYIDLVKASMEKEFEYKGCVIAYIPSPKSEVLKTVFALLHRHSKKMYFVLFSDDSCVSIRTITGFYWADVDISACDGSHYSPLFSVLKACISHPLYQSDIDKAFKQLQSDLWLYSTDMEHRVKLTLADKNDMVLLSGSVLTVVANNTANVSIAMRIADNLPNFVDENDVEEIIMRSAKEMGYLVTCQRKTNFEELTFLKMSSTVDGRLFLGLGVLIRSFGRFLYDLPGRGDIAARARRFNSDVIKSYVHAGDHIITDAFRKHIIHDSLNCCSTAYMDATRVRGCSSDRVEVHELCRRYRCTEVELEELAECISNARVGSVISLPIIDKIMSVDYGY